MDKTETLKACPFCGGAPHLEHHEHPYSSGQNYWTVLCAKCGCEMGGADCPTEAEAIAAWNERTPRPDNALADELAKHWLADVGCLHDDSPTGGSNKPSCSCGWTGERVATVGDAARLWARHALAALRQPVDAIDAELVERLARLIDVRRDFVAKREAMNAAIPDVVNGTPAERALYDERYKADHEAEHALYREALGFAAWAAEANPLSRTPSPEKAEIERLRNIAQRVAEMETVEELLTGPGIAGLTVAGKLNTMQERRIARDTLIQDARAALTHSVAVDLLREARCPLCQTAAPEAFVSQCNRPECPYRSNTK